MLLNALYFPNNPLPGVDEIIHGVDQALAAVPEGLDGDAFADELYDHHIHVCLKLLVHYCVIVLE